VTPATVTIRPLRWPQDRPQLAALDTSYVAESVLRLRRDDLAFALVEEPVDPPLRRRYVLEPDDLERLAGAEHAAGAEADGALAGVVGAGFAAWNRRVRVEHLYVAPGARRRGAGRALMESVLAFARRKGARCVWLETQAENAPAARFYRRLGFRLCGLDVTLYDPLTLGPEAPDTALFFALDL
jgi:ribosomal protein S18 acetylase RimI-like enzyme